MYLEDQRDSVLSSLYLFYCQVSLHVSGVSSTHHQQYTNCSHNNWYRSWIWRYNDKIWLKRVHGRAATSLWSWPKWGSCCNYSLCTPDDGCGRHQKRVEWLGSKPNKDCLELHLVCLLNTPTYDARKYEHKIWTKKVLDKKVYAPQHALVRTSVRGAQLGCTNPL
jgi:hypothetical protein